MRGGVAQAREVTEQLLDRLTRPVSDPTPIDDRGVTLDARLIRGR
jgi:hypothetical protein